MEETEELLERIQELEARERDLLIAAEMGRDLLDRNTDLELECKSLSEENENLKQKLVLQKNVSVTVTSCNNIIFIHGSSYFGM